MGVTQRRQSGSVPRAKSPAFSERARDAAPRSVSIVAPATSSKRCLQRRLQEAQLRRPRRVVDLDDELRAVELHRRARERRRHRRPPPPTGRTRHPSGWPSGSGDARSGASLRSDRTTRRGCRRTAPDRDSRHHRCQLRSARSRRDAQLPAERRRSSARPGPAAGAAAAPRSAAGRARSARRRAPAPARCPTLSVTSRCAPRRRASASVRCSPCDACVRAGMPSMKNSTSSRCGPTRRHATTHVVGTGLGQGRASPRCRHGGS